MGTLSAPLSRVTLASTAATIVVCTVVGCSNTKAPPRNPPKRTLVWDLSDQPSTTKLSGGKWIPSKAGLPDYVYIYYVEGDSNLSLSVKVPENQQLDIAEIRHVEVQKHADRIDVIRIATCSMSKEAVLNRFMEMLSHWSGPGTEDKDDWRKSVNREDISTIASLINKSGGPHDPEIIATIERSDGGPNDAWHIAVVISWPSDIESHAR